MSQRDLIDAVAAVAPLPCDAAGPVFAEPWQAQAFAMVIALHGQALFTWPEWADTLSHEVKARGMADDGSRYYEFWLEALEHLAIAKGISTHQRIDDLAAAWARAAEATPHGKPIALGNDPVTGGAITL